MPEMSEWRVESITDKEKELELLDACLEERFPALGLWLLPVTSVVLGVLLWNVEIVDDVPVGAFGLGVGFVLLIGVGGYTSQTKSLERERRELVDRLERLRRTESQ